MDYDNILACFTSNYIGLKGLCDAPEKPLSGLWVNDITGITVKVLNELANLESANKAQEYFLEKQNFAIKACCEDVLSEIKSLSLNPQTVLKSEKVGEFGTTYYTPTLLNRTFGVNISANCENLGCIEIPYFDVLLENSGVINGVIIEGVYNTPFQFQVVANQITRVYINYRAKYACEFRCQSTPIQILIEDATGTLSPNQTTLKYSSCKCSSSRNGVVVNGVMAGVVNQRTTYGIVPTINFTCCFEQFFCAMKARFGFAVLWKIAVLIYEDMLLSARITLPTITKFEQKTTYLDTAKDNYKAAINALCWQFKDLLKSYKSKCLPCTGARIGILTS